MPRYRAVIRRRRTQTVNEEVTVIVEAATFEEADAGARNLAKTDGEAVRARPVGRPETGIEVGDIVSMSSTKMFDLEPESEVFEDRYVLRLVESGGVTNGHVVLWTEAALRLEKYLREAPQSEVREPEPVALPDPIPAMIAAHPKADSIRRHPGKFWKRYVDLVHELDAVLVGDEETGPALIVRRADLECIGVVMPSAQEDALRAPPLVQKCTTRQP